MEKAIAKEKPFVQWYSHPLPKDVTRIDANAWWNMVEPTGVELDSHQTFTNLWIGTHSDFQMFTNWGVPLQELVLLTWQVEPMVIHVSDDQRSVQHSWTWPIYRWIAKQKMLIFQFANCNKLEGIRNCGGFPKIGGIPSYHPFFGGDTPKSSSSWGFPNTRPRVAARTERPLEAPAEQWLSTAWSTRRSRSTSMIGVKSCAWQLDPPFFWGD